MSDLDWTRMAECYDKSPQERLKPTEEDLNSIEKLREIFNASPQDQEV